MPSGALDLTVLFHKIPVYKEHDDLCDRLESCPANGPFTVDAKQKLPPFTLPVSRPLPTRLRLSPPLPPPLSSLAHAKVFFFFFFFFVPCLRRAQGTYQLKVTAKDESAKEVACMILDLQIKGPAIF